MRPDEMNASARRSEGLLDDEAERASAFF